MDERLQADIAKRTLLMAGLVNGLKKGWEGFLWMMKIILPISFLTALLAWSGWIAYLDLVIQPLMGLMGLPAVAALPIVIGMLTNLYGGIAAMVVLPLTVDQMTLIAVFLLMAHNLIQEGIVQGQSGISPVKATVFRIVTAFVTTAVASVWLGADPLPVGAVVSAAPVREPFFDAVINWVDATLRLGVKIFFIIMAIMAALEVLKIMGWTVHVVRFFSPLLRLMGLDRNVGLLWMTAVLFGLAYGGAVIVEEARAEHITKEELEILHLSIGINHAMVEDPILFMSLGLNPFWLYVPRLVMALVSIRVVRLWYWYRWRRGRHAKT